MHRWSINCPAIRAGIPLRKSDERAIGVDGGGAASLTACACACFRGHIEDKGIVADVLGVVDDVVARRLGLGDTVDMEALMSHESEVAVC